MASYLTVVQARMGSTRLPGKVMLELCTKPVIWHVVERLKLSKKGGKVVVATSQSRSDDSLCDYLKEADIEYFRGSEHDVLDRFYRASGQYPSELIVRATADNPLVDPIIMDETIAFFEREKFRYAKTKGYPPGIGIEVFDTDLLEEAYRNAHSDYEREHVTPYMFTAQPNHGDYKSMIQYDEPRLTMDTSEDYELIRDIYEQLYQGRHDFFMADILAYMKTRECHEYKYSKKEAIEKE